MRSLGCPPIVHAMLIVSPAWVSLRLVGYQDDMQGGVLELRDCDLCGSTISRPARLAAQHPRDYEHQIETDPREQQQEETP